MGKKLGNILKTIAPIALGLAVPGIGSALGLGTFGTAALGAGVGAGASALTGGNAALGALTGGLGGYTGAGGFSSGAGSLNGLDSAGLVGQASKDLGTGFSGGSALGGVLGGGGSSYSSVLSPLASTALGSYSNDKAVKQLNEKQNQALGLYDQFSNESFNPGDLAATPGYQFQLDQSQQALDRKNAATGNIYSGAALKEAGANAQGLADSTYNDAYSQFLQTQAQKLASTGAQAGLLGNIGSAQATGTLNQGQLYSQGASGVLGGLTGNYYNPSSGTFYNPNVANTGSNTDIAALLKKLQGGV